MAQISLNGARRFIDKGKKGLWIKPDNGRALHAKIRTTDECDKTKLTNSRRRAQKTLGDKSSNDFERGEKNK